METAVNGEEEEYSEATERSDDQRVGEPIFVQEDLVNMVAYQFIKYRNKKGQQSQRLTRSSERIKVLSCYTVNST